MYLLVLMGFALWLVWMIYRILGEYLDHLTKGKLSSGEYNRPVFFGCVVALVVVIGIPFAFLKVVEILSS